MTSSNQIEPKLKSGEINAIEDCAQDIREMMLHISSLKANNSSPYPIHLALGHEKLAAAVAACKAQGDKFVLTHRNIHFNLALSSKIDQGKLIKETQVDKDGINNGNYGCMTLRNRNAGVSYTSSILGNNLSVGLGIASTLGEENITWIQMGDGSMEEGAFYEGMVFAAAQKLKVIILIENNNWSLGTSINERRQEILLGKLAEAIGFQYTYISIDDEKTEAMVSKIKCARANALNIPQIIECKIKTVGGKQNASRGYVSYHHGPIKEDSN